jgi:hypothetical protein
MHLMLRPVWDLTVGAPGRPGWGQLSWAWARLLSLKPKCEGTLRLRRPLGTARPGPAEKAELQRQ